MKFVKSTFYYLISEKKEENWEDHLMEKENSEGKIKLKSESGLSH